MLLSQTARANLLSFSQRWRGKGRLHLAPPFLVEDYEPVAQQTARAGNLPGKLKEATRELMNCRACPRDCGVNRLEDKRGVCRVGRKALVSSAFPHFGEESVLQGWKGSGTIFFGMCNMRCVFCQNHDISQTKKGWELDAAEIADLMLKLQEETGCHNINFVTPEHVAPQVAEAIAAAVDMGLNVPIVYNTSSYDGTASLQLMDGLVDIYMPDFKFWKGKTAQRLAKATNYPETARAAIKEMHRQVGDLVFDANGLAKRGILLRHLVMPGQLDEAQSILQWVAKELSKDTYVHIMEQYRPAFRVGVGGGSNSGNAGGDQSGGDGNDKRDLSSGGGDLDRATGIRTRYQEIDRSSSSQEIEAVMAFAREQGLWRFEEPRNW